MHAGLKRAVTGLAAGALATTALLGAFALGWLAGVPFVPYTVFEWLIKVLPGRVVTFGLDTTLSVLNGLGLNVKDTAKTAEQVLAVAAVFAAGLVIGLLFFALTRNAGGRRVRLYGLATGAAVGAFSFATAWAQGVPAGIGGKIGFVFWTLLLCGVWGFGIGGLYLAAFRAMDKPARQRRDTPLTIDAEPPAGQPPNGAPPAVAPSGAEAHSAEARVVEARPISRRRFLIQMGGLAATIVVVGAGVAEILRSETSGTGPGPVTQTTFPNDDSSVEPAPGTRPEYTPVADVYRTDIALSVPELDPATWRLIVDGAVQSPLSLTLDQLRSEFDPVDHFVTLSCVGNLIGGPLIGTTLWTGAPLHDVLERAKPLADARYAHVYAEDGFDEQVDLQLVRTDARIMLTYAWDGQPLPAKHGFPLRVLIPGRYGMKQPKWITRISLLADSIPGYWVSRGWDATAEVRTTSVIDTVGTKSIFTREGKTYVPIGGIAYSGAKGISKVEIQVDDLPWQSARLREPLSDLTWVIWRYDWPFSAGTHYFAVRCYDGQGVMQETEKRGASPSGATGLYKEYREF